MALSTADQYGVLHCIWLYPPLLCRSTRSMHSDGAKSLSVSIVAIVKKPTFHSFKGLLGQICWEKQWDCPFGKFSACINWHNVTSVFVFALLTRHAATSFLTLKTPPLWQCNVTNTEKEWHSSSLSCSYIFLNGRATGDHISQCIPCSLI